MAVGYCTIDQITSAFPQFERNAPGSIPDSDIQGWISDRKARIRSAFLTRGIDTDTTTDTDQLGFLRSLNRDGGIADLGVALQGAITLQPGEYSLAAAHGRAFEAVLKEIKDGLHDRLFKTTARIREVRQLAGGIGGADTDPTVTPPDQGENRYFWKNQIF